MKCKKARKLIVDFLCGELPDGSNSELQKHLAGCSECLEYKGEMQQTITYIKDNETQISDEMLVLDRPVIGKIRYSVTRWPVWAAAAIFACSVLLFVFVFSATEVQYVDSALTIRFRGGSGRQEMESKLKAELTAQMESIYQRTENILEEYKNGQSQFEKQMVKEMMDYGNILSKTIELLNERDSQRDKQVAIAFQQLQIRQNQIFNILQRNLDSLASETQKEFERNYEAMATVAQLMAAGGY